MSLPPTLGHPSTLSGQRILITRPMEPSQAAFAEDQLSSRLKQWGATVIWIPLIETRPMPFEWSSAVGYDWIFFTSKNAVRSFLAQSGLKEQLAGARLAVVGPATGRCVEQMGWSVDFVSPSYHAEGAAEAFGQVSPCDGLRILWPCGNMANPALKEHLQAAGAMVTPLTVYQTQLKLTLSANEWELLSSLPDLVVFTSPSAVEAWGGLARQGEARLLQLPVACLGPKTAREAEQRLGPVHVQANPHTLEALAQAIYAYFSEGVLP